MKPATSTLEMPRSGIREIMDLASTVEGVIHLEIGEPNFETPRHIIEAASKAALDGFTGYTPTAGIPRLREVLASKVRERNGIHAASDQIVVTAGAVAGLYGTLAALIDPGSEVLLPDPCWPNYALMMRLQGIEPVYFPLQLDAGLVPNVNQIEPLITENTRGIILNSPGNPTGTITPEDSVRALLDMANAHDLWVFSDEVYDEMWFDEPPVPMAPFDSDDRVVTFFSMSKTYAMTGWRVGYLVSPPGVSEVITNCQEPITLSVNAPAQMAAIAAISGPQDAVSEMRNSYRQRRDLVVNLLDARGISYVRPRGAFYVMVDVTPSGIDDMEFAKRLLTDKRVAVVPGKTFGPRSGRFARVSLATAPDLLIEGVGRIADAVNEWGD